MQPQATVTAPINRSAGISIDLQEQALDLQLTEILPQVRAQLVDELLNVKLSTAIVIGILRGWWNAPREPTTAAPPLPTCTKALRLI